MQFVRALSFSNLFRSLLLTPLLVFTTVGFCISARAFRDTTENFKLSICIPKTSNCYRLSSPESVESVALRGLYVMKDAKLEILHDEKLVETIVGVNSYYDSNILRVLLRKPNGKPGELAVDIESGKKTFFEN